MSIRYNAEASDMLQMIFEDFNDHQLHTLISLKNHIDEVCLKKAIELSFQVFPLINSRYVEGFFKAYWEKGSATSEDILEVIKSENPEKDIDKIIVTRTEEFNGPQMKVYIIREKTKDSICIIINHMLSDAGGFKEYLYILSSIYSDLKVKGSCELKEKMGSRSLDQVFRQLSLKEKARILFTSSKISKYDSGNSFKLEGDKRNPFIATYKIPKEKFLKIRAYAKKNGATINDVMLSAYLRTLKKFLKCSNFPIPCAVDLRKYIKDRKAEGICNLVSNMICYVDDIGESFDETLIKIKKTMDAEKENASPLKAMLLLQTAFKFLPYKISKKVVTKTFKNPPIAMTNIGLIDKKRLLFYGAVIEDAYMSGSIKYKEYFQIAVTTFDDKSTLSINMHGSLKDKVQINEFLKSFDNELEFA
ncbi:DUF1298 domain-containing protein [Clostridium sp. 19966]|uniref:WS/DGAT domain-containing protein n=1 Tax=Clostridium sp. 19966 TaxID=2768166 RepID=UPI0028DF266E|nr:WS/DGAT domain-containing protein [Clostridium sp. 19966]MDT8718004.1 DUF1298 domain-containing protein [Clostridium sp. 19966]